ncbi:hypothetical protein G5I_13236 [Acromyrmex echinatior]|uniref:Uncharacterized protein n=1 Tax=Acromyrmex echinatior TaxID=103372 RepID=F4X4H5_ACREC|nr:hypothetical protein G5I_13236 [Acromyrmex echinatior]
MKRPFYYALIESSNIEEYNSSEEEEDPQYDIDTSVSDFSNEKDKLRVDDSDTPSSSLPSVKAKKTVRKHKNQTSSEKRYKSYPTCSCTDNYK